ncbi:MAG: hypothetical protein ACRC1T_05070 [Clostridium chrysemydis]|uniref:hypothetical protein n=1 Tax=Clostridium chrysemydis TaxID=2665504 RepID=UPI003F4158FE
MKQIKLYLKDDFKSWDTDWKDVKPFRILSVSDDTDLWERAIRLDDTYYTICAKQGENYQIEELPSYDLNKEETFGEDEIKCPICGYEISDSWECEDDGGEEVCGGCGSILEWNRVVEVTYSTTVKEKTRAIRL